eukprot:jgi/Psemu1/41966/gm1.41966_g
MEITTAQHYSNSNSNSLGDDTTKNAGCDTVKESRRMANITPQPSAVFSTTSSSPALSCCDGIDHVRDHNAENYDYNYDCDCDYDYDSAHRDDHNDDDDDRILDMDGCEMDCGRGALAAAAAATKPPPPLPRSMLLPPRTSEKIPDTRSPPSDGTGRRSGRFVLFDDPWVPNHQPADAAGSGRSDSNKNSNRHQRAQRNNRTGRRRGLHLRTGGGFSGFWFSLGRLQSLDHPQNERFVCYSAGCLGVVSVLRNHFDSNSNNNSNSNSNSNNNTGAAAAASSKHYQYEQLYEYARSIQTGWQSGAINRYRVVETFVDGILDSLETLDESSTEAFLEIIRTNLYIVTTVFHDDNDNDNGDPGHHEASSSSSSSWSSSSLIPRATLQQPHDMPSLKRMLLQTTWIPLATAPPLPQKGGLSAFGGTSDSASASGGTTITDRSSTSVVAPASSPSSPPWYDSFERSAILWTNTLNVNMHKRDGTLVCGKRKGKGQRDVGVGKLFGGSSWKDG